MGPFLPRKFGWHPTGWLYQLEGTNIHTWEDLVAAFYKQYQYNADLAPTRTQLQGMSMGAGEGFKEEGPRWKSTTTLG